MPRWRPRSLQLDQHRDGPVVAQIDQHSRAEDPALGAETLTEALVERLCLLGWRGADVARARSLAGIAVERELADDKRFALADRLVHAAVGVGEDPQPPDLVGE